MSKLYLVLVLLLSFTMPAFAKKKDFKTFNLKVNFVVGAAQGNDSDMQTWLKKVVDLAESLYTTKPKLKISYTTEVKTRAGGRDLNELHFESARVLSKYMDANFDHVAESKTRGHLTVLVSDKICYMTRVDGKKKEKCIGGRAYFPHWMDFNRYHGILMRDGNSAGTFAHEMGHMMGLKHTFARYYNINPKMNCNTDYRPLGKPEGKCASCKGTVVTDSDGDKSCTGKVNVMDYCSGSDGEYLNRCQKDRSAKQRRKYMTRKGKVNYNKLKGLWGKPNCKEDSDCSSGKYCWTGVIGIGRNQCRTKRANGKSCAKAKQCKSGRCKLFVCKAEIECKKDSDCGSTEYCWTGVAGVGENKCKSKKKNGKGCTKDKHCKSGRCAGFKCKDEIECKKDSDCSSTQYCWTGVAGVGKNDCKAKKKNGKKCTKDKHCKSGRCSAFKCKAEVKCRKDKDCKSSQYCDKGKLGASDNKCRSTKSKGKSCKKNKECKSGKCKRKKCK